MRRGEGLRLRDGRLGEWGWQLRGSRKRRTAGNGELHLRADLDRETQRDGPRDRPCRRWHNGRWPPRRRGFPGLDARRGCHTFTDGLLKECETARVVPEPRLHVANDAADADPFVGDPLHAGGYLQLLLAGKGLPRVPFPAVDEAIHPGPDFFRDAAVMQGGELPLIVEHRRP